jgi:hypothetical protein
MNPMKLRRTFNLNHMSRFNIKIKVVRKCKKLISILLAKEKHRKTMS